MISDTIEILFYFPIQLECNKYEQDALHYAVEIIHGIESVGIELCGLELFNGPHHNYWLTMARNKKNRTG